MRTKIITLILCVMLTVISKAQNKRYRDANGFTHIDTTAGVGCPILVEKENTPTILSSYLIMSYGDNISSHFLKKEDAKKLYNVECTLDVKLKPEIELIRFKQLLIDYDISLTNQSLPVFVDKMQIVHPQSIVAVKRLIKSVEIITNPDNKERYISITTTKPHPAGGYVN